MSHLTEAVPITSIDGFYDNPDAVREYALTLDYQTAPQYAGARSLPLHELDPDLFQYFSYRLMSLMFDLQYAQAGWEIFTAFHIVDPTEHTPSWIHQDNQDCLAAGVIYLTDGLDFEEGTSFYLPTSDVSGKVDEWSKVKEAYHGSGVDLNYESVLQHQHKCFKETARIGARYNRLALYESSLYHAARPSRDKQRLTQVFFLKKLSSVSKLPVQRLRKINRRKDESVR